ncbi:exocyst complex component SEC6 [Pyrus ussuriensis x Pyrus communis]|uniref:Exocyst complex component SEC6 n=1 Tax=Pyrus ussuriensis x Pyrus communis TaxID=2448454 RepID=A0A5N5I7Z8_9ROSA|nr:exocyst complex component SEC6 [Pyrus ussuriensis x Pyrus communis]
MGPTPIHHHSSPSVISPFLLFELQQQPRHNPSATTVPLHSTTNNPITAILESSLHIQSKSLTCFIKFEVDRFKLQIYVAKFLGFSGGFALVKGGQFYVFVGIVGFADSPNGKMGLLPEPSGAAVLKDLGRDGAGVLGKNGACRCCCNLKGRKGRTHGREVG